MWCMALATTKECNMCWFAFRFSFSFVHSVHFGVFFLLYSVFHPFGLAFSLGSIASLSDAIAIVWYSHCQRESEQTGERERVSEWNRPFGECAVFLCEVIIFFSSLFFDMFVTEEKIPPPKNQQAANFESNTENRVSWSFAMNSKLGIIDYGYKRRIQMRIRIDRAASFSLATYTIIFTFYNTRRQCTIW